MSSDGDGKKKTRNAPAERKDPGPRVPYRENLARRQLTAIQPYLPELIRRYDEVAEKGETERDDPLCREVGTGGCYKCAVFGEKMCNDPHGRHDVRQGSWVHCSEYMPVPPGCVEVRDDGVYLTNDNGERMVKGRTVPASRDRSRAWGRKMVEYMKSLQQQ